MTITVYGAGAIGGVTGAELVRAGHDVLLVDRAVDHVAAMNAHGLTIDRGAGSLTVPVRAVTPDALGMGLELVLPLTERLIAMIEDLEAGRRVMSWANIDELVGLERAGRR